MAGGSGNRKDAGSLDKDQVRPYNVRRYRNSRHPLIVTPEPSLSKIFKSRHKLERQRIYTETTHTLQRDILRIFAECMYSDFNVIHGNRVVKTNACIVRTRSPKLYEALDTKIVHINNTIKCYIEKPEIFQQIKDFSRLLYSNLDIKREEEILLKLIKSTDNLPLTDASKEYPSNPKERGCQSLLYSKLELVDHSDTINSDVVYDLSPSTSEMADSGLETGSISPQEDNTTESENSVTDLEESHCTEYVSIDDDFIKISVNGNLERSRHKKMSSNHNGHRDIDAVIKSGISQSPFDSSEAAGCSSCYTRADRGDSSTSLPSAVSTVKEKLEKTNTSLDAEEIAQYENQVLSDAFYDSDCASIENEASNIFVPSESFEFVEATSSQNLVCPDDDSKIVEEAPSMFVEELRHESSNSNELPLNNSSSNSINNCYFIDASSLNDDLETSVKLSSASKDCDEKLPSYVPSRSGKTDEQCHKLTTRKLSNRNGGHEGIAEFERELKMTEYLKPMKEQRRVKRVDSVTEDKSSDSSDKSIEKETLVVEIKEADSGESAHPSPSTDNNKNTKKKRDINASETKEEKHESDETDEDSQSQQQRRRRRKQQQPPIDQEKQTPTLIRRNTFQLDPNDEKLSTLRQEYERRQGHLLFQSSIPQYSGHRVDGDAIFEPPLTENLSCDPVTDLVGKFELPKHSGDKYSSITYHCADKSKISVLKTTEQENPVKINSKFKSDNYTKNAMISHASDDKLPIASFFVNDSPEEITSWISDGNFTMTKSASDKILADSCSESEESSRNCCNSLPVTLNSDLLVNRRFDLIKKRKRDETTPIVSGGAVNYSKSTESPIVNRKIDSTPIVSGGSVMINDDETETRDRRVKTTRMASSMTSWVVDMSDCGKNSSKPVSDSSMSQSFSYSDCANDKNSTRIKSDSKQNSLGFFVNLNDIDSPKEKDEKDLQPIAKQSCEFFVDISNDTIKKNANTRNIEEKKNIFSMFINLQESIEDASKIVENLEDSKKTLKLQRDDSGESCSNSHVDPIGIDKNLSKPSVFMFIESDSPVVRRRALSSSRPGAFQRHSWNVDKSQLQINCNGITSKDNIVRREHKRAHSVSVDRGDLKILQGKSSNSSRSLSEVARADTLIGLAGKKFNGHESSSRNTDTSTEEIFEYDIRDTPPNSHIEIDENSKGKSYKEQQTEIHEIVEDSRVYEDEFSDISGLEKTGTESTEGHTRKSETFDISSASGASPETDNHQDLDLDDLPNGEIVDFTKILQPTEHDITVNKISVTHKSLTETIKKIECELKKPDYRDFEINSSESVTPISRKDTKSSSRDSKEGQQTKGISFVRLSDLDKTPVRSRVTEVNATREETTRSNSAGRNLYRMSNSIPETSWVESKLAMNNSNAPVRTLSRKFVTVMSTSLPAKHKSPIEDADCDGETIISESDLSSLQSSMCRSGADVSTEETETSSMGVTKPYNRLGEDLLRMFLEEINPDVTIDVGGRRIRAHKCILSSRCQYFAAILSGGWIESAGNVISLQGFSFNAIHFALCHIYSGESNIPETLSIVELATLADMLCLEGLKEVIGYTLKVKYCHLFHKPCQVCSVGVLECMPLAAAYGLDEVYRKSLRWITRHFVRIWPCKAFATLPRELMDKCYHQHIVHMSTDNVLQTMMDCDKLLATLPNVRWAEPVFRMVSNLLETAVKFISENFSGVLANDNFQALGRDLTWNISRLEDNFLAAADRLPPDQACKSYSRLNKMLAAAQIEEPLAKPSWGPLFVDFLRKIHTRVEKCLVKEASRAARTTTWLKMDLELRRRIQELACLVILPHEALKRPSRHSNFLKEPRVPPPRTPANRNVDLRRVKLAISEQTDKQSTKPVVTTVAPTTMSAPSTTQQVKKSLLVKPKSDPLERKITQEEKQVVSESAALRPKSWPNKLEVKSRYLEPRNKSITKDSVQQMQHERVIVQQRRKIMISSSDSSRTSSPAMKRASEKKPLAKIKLPIKKDVKALSSDSLAEASSSKTTGTSKKDTVSKSCGITRPESPSLKKKDGEVCISADSLVGTEPKRKQQQQVIAKKKSSIKMDNSMSTDSLMGEISVTPKSSNASNKVSPTLARVAANKTQAYDRVKKSSPPMQQRSPLSSVRRLPRTLECSTAASRNRAAAISSAYHGSPNLRRNLLEAAKTPDVPLRSINGVISRINPRQQIIPPTLPSAAATSLANSIGKKDKKDINQPISESPGKKSSPKANGRTNRIINAGKRSSTKITSDDKAKIKCHNTDVTKIQPTVGSRSGTFLKDEPTILKKTDMKSFHIGGS